MKKTNRRIQTSTRVQKPIARQGGGFFSLVKLDDGFNSYYEVAEISDRWEMIRQYEVTTVLTDRRQATERDLEVANRVLTLLIYANEFPGAAMFEHTYSQIDAILTVHYGRDLKPVSVN